MISGKKQDQVWLLYAHASIPSIFRLLRLEFAHALYRITFAGDRRQDIDSKDDYKELFLYTKASLIDFCNNAAQSVAGFFVHRVLVLCSLPVSIAPLHGVRNNHGVYRP